MNDLQQELLLDTLRDAARKRRKKRQALASALVLIPLCLFTKVALTPNNPAPAITSKKPAPQVTEIKETPPEELPYTTINSDEELLALLADQGPILVSHPDGSQTLILTTPHPNPAPLPAF